MGRPTKNLLNQRFGRLITLSRTTKGAANHTWWVCQCDCGNQKAIAASKLLTGHTKSCGCLALDTRTRHGLRRGGEPSIPEYNSWDGMIQRCHNPKNPAYKNYGARGIKVCDEWRNGFKPFLDHVGKKPSSKHSIDRIDNNGDYAPGNVRWSTRHVQNTNRRPSIPKGTALGPRKPKKKAFPK